MEIPEAFSLQYYQDEFDHSLPDTVQLQIEKSSHDLEYNVQIMVKYII